MSHQAVCDFYLELARSSELAAAYCKLTSGWLLGYRPAKIVTFAALRGHHFSVEELRHVRLTNYHFKSGMSTGDGYYSDEADYEPTAHPHPPESAAEFRAAHGRDVDRESTTGVAAPGDRERRQKLT